MTTISLIDSHNIAVRYISSPVQADVDYVLCNLRTDDEMNVFGRTYSSFHLQTGNLHWHSRNANARLGNSIELAEPRYARYFPTRPGCQHRTATIG